MDSTNLINNNNQPQQQHIKSSLYDTELWSSLDEDDDLYNNNNKNKDYNNNHNNGDDYNGGSSNSSSDDDDNDNNNTKSNVGSNHQQQHRHHLNNYSPNIYYKDFTDDDQKGGISSNPLNIQITSNITINTVPSQQQQQQPSHNQLSRSLPSLLHNDLCQSSSETTPYYVSPLQQTKVDIQPSPSSFAATAAEQLEKPLPPPPVPPRTDRTHKRYLSTSAMNSTSTSHHHHQHGSPSSPYSGLYSTFIPNHSSSTDLHGHASTSGSSSPKDGSKTLLKNKLLKVITSVKNIPIPQQVDSIINNLKNSNSNNNSPSSSNPSSPSTSFSSLPFLNHLRQQQPSQPQQQQQESNNSNEVPLSSSLPTTTASSTFSSSPLEPSYFHNNNSNYDAEIDNNQNYNNDCNNVNNNNNIDNIDNNNNNIVNPIVNHHEETIEGLTFEVVEKDTVNSTPSKPLPSTPPPLPQQQQRISSPSLLHISYRSSVLNQLSQQQSRTERSKFSLPLVDISPYPKLSADELSSISSPSYPSLDFENNHHGGDSGGSNEDFISYPSIQSNGNNRVPTTTTTYKDITLQKYKSLPPTPFNQQPLHQQQQLQQQQQQSKGNKGKFNNILQLLSISIPSPRGDSQNNSNNNSSQQYQQQQEKYRDLTQYLNENGDRIKISQHIQWHLDQPNVNVDIVKLLGTHYGFPDHCRATSWMLMAGYLPARSDIRASVLLNKRLQYRDLVKKYFGDQFKNFHVDENDFERGTNKLLNNVADLWSQTALGQNEKSKFKDLLQQIHIDVIRTRPDGFYELFELKEIEQMSERILAIWSSENTDLSYFQGLNDLLCPFLIVFLGHAISQMESSPSKITYPNLYPEEEDIASLTKSIGDGVAVKEMIQNQKFDILSKVEADIYWCLSSLLNSVKPYATNTGCGLPAEGMMKKLSKLVQESNEELYNHFMKQQIDFSHFSFRWMVCFLVRDVSFETGVKLWDRYMCDKNNEGFSLLHISLCAALLSDWSSDLLNMEFMELVQTLQKSDLVDIDSLDSIIRNASYIRDTYRHIISL
ncbi:RabGAP/TBC domain-containing protein [Cavenderia fasciculata]|uniref:RabGAP/TBC domain-containing protein n=1 Tax=Cavenderia fasciculata TaxID=261658 RepID=F4PLE7_CACFS|nr:RabGAP/TBC domain-containing protein [Cavenderia fasciculata]EGG23369.1 RabGAP/TBC domain-containing protein [Cavenderia fasciculata]|eukprot:XP_004361220.1 RabGAP/TBC domain-containing protein [Cavenderia fasciculata]